MGTQGHVEIQENPQWLSRNAVALALVRRIEILDITDTDAVVHRPMIAMAIVILMMIMVIDVAIRALPHTAKVILTDLVHGTILRDVVMAMTTLRVVGEVVIILQVEGAAVIVRPEDVAATTHHIADIVRLGGIHAKETVVILLADGRAPPTMFGLIQAEGPCRRDRLEHPTLWWNLRNQVGHGPVAVFPPSYPRGLAEHPHLYLMRRKGVLAGPERDCVHHTGHVERRLFRT